MSLESNSIHSWLRAQTSWLDRKGGVLDLFRGIPLKAGFLCFLVGVFAPLGFAAPRLRVEPPARQISVEERATLKVRLEWPATEGPYEIHSLEPKLENLSLQAQNQSQETGATVAHTITYEFQPLKKGSAIIYSFEVSYRKDETEPWIPILVPEQKIRVVSSFPFKPILLGLVILGGVSLLAGAGLKIAAVLKAREAAKSIMPPDPKQRVYAQAEEAIATFASPHAREKLTHWGHQLRTVVATYYDIPSKSASAVEILTVLKSKGLQAGEWNEVSRLVGQLNEMQFSRQDVPAYELEQMQKSLLQYVKGKIIIENPPR